MIETAAFLAEEQLLIALAKPHSDNTDFAEAEAALSRPEFNWLKTLSLARAHLVLPMLAWNLRAQKSIWTHLPDTVRTELEMSFLLVAQRRSRYHAAVGSVFGDLLSKAIPFVLMKGAVVMETIYPPNTRLLNDLDMLIPGAYRSVAIDIFSKSGFHVVKAPPKSDAHELSLVRRSGEVFLSIDLHWDVYPKHQPFHFDIEEIFARARSQTFGYYQVRGMSAEHTFVHYATQLYIDNLRHSFLRLCDLYGLAAAHLDPNRLVSIASGTGAVGITHAALKIAGALGTLPPILPRSLEQICSDCSVASEFLTDPRWLFGRRRIAGGAVEYLLSTLLSDSHQRRNHWLRLRSVYAWQRECGHSVGTALLCMARSMLSPVVCGGLLRVTAAGPLAGNARLRGLLWRKP